MIRNVELIRAMQDRIAQLIDEGAEGIRVVQARRYIDADIIPVRGRWFAVTTTPGAAEDIDVVCSRPPAKSFAWVDENGRAITGEVSYEGNY